VKSGQVGPIFRTDNDNSIRRNVIRNAFNSEKRGYPCFKYIKNSDLFDTIERISKCELCYLCHYLIINGYFSAWLIYLVVKVGILFCKVLFFSDLSLRPGDEPPNIPPTVPGHYHDLFQ